MLNKVTLLKQNSWINCHRNQEYWRTREREECSCNGHKINCDFYDIRNKAFEKNIKERRIVKCLQIVVKDVSIIQLNILL